jgi:hypothetical protein
MSDLWYEEDPPPEWWPTDEEPEEEEEEETVLTPLPAIPNIYDGIPVHVDYSTRNPGDFMISGPVPPATGPGRVFSTTEEAYEWAIRKYGIRRVVKVPFDQSPRTRWCLLIRGV